MIKKGNVVVRISAREATLKRRLRRHVTSLGFHKTEDGMLALPGTGKDVVRTIHNVQRDDWLEANRSFISKRFPKLIEHFASGEGHRRSPDIAGPPADIQRNVGRRPVPPCITDLVSAGFERLRPAA